MSDLSFNLHEAKRNFPLLEQSWCQLYQSERDGFFLSFPWVKTWLQSLPDQVSAKLLTVESEGEILLACLIGCSQNKSRNLFSLTEGHVNETGILEIDDVVIERNGFLSALSNKTQVLSVPELLKKLGLNKVRINNIHQDHLKHILQHIDLGSCKKFVSNRPSYYVSLDQVRASYDGYLSLLSANKRRQIKRSKSLYTQKGELLIQEASSVTEALLLFDKMVELHQKEWQTRGKDGSFSNDFILTLHKKLITDYYHAGQICLFNFYNDEGSIGIIYGFISGDDFLYYQSGFNYSDDNRRKPGLTCHSMLVQFLAGKGLKCYDFLAGDAPYKKSLSTGSYGMSHIEFFDSSIKSRLYLFARSVRRSIRNKY